MVNICELEDMLTDCKFVQSTYLQIALYQLLVL